MAVTISLERKTAIVTGGGRGIGKAITRKLAEAGANVAIASRKLANLEATAEEFKNLPGKVLPVQTHVGRLDDLEALVTSTEKEFGPVDILVNNSATNIGQGPALELTPDMIDKMIDINIKSALVLVNWTVPGMIGRGGGSIINIASIAGLRPQYQGLLYSFTKAGLIMMTRSWAQEFGPHNVRVNAIAPGLIKTDLSAYFWENEEHMKTLREMQPIGRVGEAEEIGMAAVLLASDHASFMTGETIVIDGGAMWSRGWTV